MRAYVAVGANQGDRWASLARAARELRGSPGVSVLRASRVWDTAPVGPPQPRYLNAVLELETSLTPRRLLGTLQRIERVLGRKRAGQRWGPRPMDLDLLLAGEARLCERGLAVPHPRIAERRFVLAPLAELCAERVVPGTDRTVAELLAGAPPDDVAPVGPYPL